MELFKRQRQHPPWQPEAGEWEADLAELLTGATRGEQSSVGSSISFLLGKYAARFASIGGVLSSTEAAEVAADVSELVTVAVGKEFLVPRQPARITTPSRHAMRPPRGLIDISCYLVD